MSRSDALDPYQPRTGDPADGYISASDALESVNHIYDDMDTKDKGLDSRVTVVENLVLPQPPAGSLLDRVVDIETFDNEVLRRLGLLENGVPKATQFRGVVADQAALAAIPTPKSGDLAVTTSDGHLHVYSAGAWTNIGPASSTLAAGSRDGDHLMWNDTTKQWEGRTLTTVTPGATGSKFLSVHPDGELEWVDNTAMGGPGPKGEKGDIVGYAATDSDRPVAPKDGEVVFNAARRSLDYWAAGAGTWTSVGDLPVFTDVAALSAAWGAGAEGDLAYTTADGVVILAPDPNSTGNLAWKPVGALTLAALTDTDVSPQDGDGLVFNATTGKWVASADRLGDETNINGPLDASNDGGSFVYDEGSDGFEVRKLALGDLSDGPGNSTPSDFDVLTFDATKQQWLPEAPAMTPYAKLAGAAFTGAVSVTSGSPTAVGLTVKAALAGTANSQEWQNSAGTVGAKVDAAGKATFAGVTNTAGVVNKYSAKTSDYTITTSDYVVACAGTFTVTLPTAVSDTGRTFVVKNTGSGRVTIAGKDAETIDGVSTQELPTQFQSITLMSTGTDWVIL